MKWHGRKGREQEQKQKENESFKSRWLVDCVWNVTAHAQKPDFVFRWNGRVHLNRRGASVQSTTGSQGVRISGSNAGYTMFRGCVKSTGYPPHSPVSPSLPLPWVTVFLHVSTGLYLHHPCSRLHTLHFAHTLCLCFVWLTMTRDWPL
jgi:hypothetical protein